MIRTASTVCLSAWATFLAAGAARLVIEAGVLPGSVQGASNQFLATVRQGEALAVEASVAVPFAVLLIGVCAVIAVSIIKLASDNRADIVAGESAAVAGLVAVFAFWLSATVAGSPASALFGGGAGVCFALAFTLGALLFDHLMHADESESDEAFEMVMRRVEEANGFEAERRSQHTQDYGDKR